MKPIRIFISGVQKEFAIERSTLRDYLQSDQLLRRFFEPFLFEEVPAADRRADELYLNEVQQCDIYLGFFGNDYGWEDDEGISPTHREFDEATRLGKFRLIFVKGADDKARHPKMLALVQTAGEQLIRRRFTTPSELITSVYASLVQYLEMQEMLRNGPFDAAFCRNATLDDLDEEKISIFLRRARKTRGYALDEHTEPHGVLEHLNLLSNGRPSHAAILLFGKRPQRFLISSEVKCMHFHTTQVRKPIPSYHIYKGTVFELVDQAVDFVMSKIDLWVGTRAESTQVPVQYEIPAEVVREAIVNAVAHRNYTSNASVQVMLFPDRLEVWNPGELRPPLTLEKLTQPHPSLPGNPLIAEPLYLTKYIEKAGSGTLDMIELCRDAGLRPPEFRMDVGCFILTIRRKDRNLTEQAEQPESSTSPVPVQYQSLEGRVLDLLREDDLPTSIISKNLGQSRVSGQLKVVLNRLLSEAFIEYTIPEKPNSRYQKYRLAERGRERLKRLKG
ncbi:MAG: DUF4062 domain-containing protein [bacterium]|nr:DUF4062 domain-containing protein [bacterium]